MNARLNQPSYHHGDLKAAVLARAAEIISEQGIEALSLRAVARDLGVSHGAPNRHFKNKVDLLAALSADIWQKMHNATLAEANAVPTDDPIRRLNALGRGFLRWALENKSAFQTINHPDLKRYVSDEVRAAQGAFQGEVAVAVAAAQQAGRYPHVNLPLLTLYTNSVPFGCAMLLSNAVMSMDAAALDQEQLIEDLIGLVVPLQADNQKEP
jgi:AcrR family transcriptional regulator